MNTLESVVEGNSFNHQTVYRLLFNNVETTSIETINVSITKRCTDCFRGNYKMRYIILVSITKRCTDCFFADDFENSVVCA